MKHIVRFIVSSIFVGMASSLFAANSNPADSIPSIRIDEVKVSVAPNPAKDYVIISVNSDFDFIIFSANGKQSYSVSDCSESYKMDVTSLSSGVYILNVLVDENIYTKRFIVEK